MTQLFAAPPADPPPGAVVISSAVAASRVGSAIAVPILQAAGVEALAVPTVTLGRHPGWGSPGGGAVAPDRFADLLAGLAKHPGLQGLRAVATGYFADPAQIDAAAAFIRERKTADPALFVLVDPVMGDAPGGLYVPEPVADAVAAVLVPLADAITPNRWELARLTGAPVDQPADADAARRATWDDQGPVVFASSVAGRVAGAPVIGAVRADPDGAVYAGLPARPDPPNGVGDAFAALLLAGRLRGLSDNDALAAAVGGVDALIGAAAAAGAAELSAAGLAGRLANARPAPLVQAADAAP